MEVVILLSAILVVLLVLGALLGLIGLVIFRERPEEVAHERASGKSFEQIAHDAERRRRLRSYSRWVIIIGVAGIVYLYAEGSD